MDGDAAVDPRDDPDAAGFFAVSVDKALAAGLSYRQLSETVKDTLTWSRTRPAGYTCVLV